MVNQKSTSMTPEVVSHLRRERSLLRSPESDYMPPIWRTRSTTKSKQTSTGARQKRRNGTRTTVSEKELVNSTFQETSIQPKKEDTTTAASTDQNQMILKMPLTTHAEEPLNLAAEKDPKCSDITRRGAAITPIKRAFSLVSVEQRLGKRPKTLEKYVAALDEAATLREQNEKLTAELNETNGYAECQKNNLEEAMSQGKKLFKEHKELRKQKALDEEKIESLKETNSKIIQDLQSLKARTTSSYRFWESNECAIALYKIYSTCEWWKEAVGESFEELSEALQLWQLVCPEIHEKIAVGRMLNESDFNGTTSTDKQLSEYGEYVDCKSLPDELCILLYRAKQFVDAMKSKGLVISELGGAIKDCMGLEGRGVLQATDTCKFQALVDKGEKLLQERSRLWHNLSEECRHPDTTDDEDLSMATLEIPKRISEAESARQRAEKQLEEVKEARKMADTILGKKTRMVLYWAAKAADDSRLEVSKGIDGLRDALLDLSDQYDKEKNAGRKSFNLQDLIMQGADLAESEAEEERRRILDREPSKREFEPELHKRPFIWKSHISSKPDVAPTVARLQKPGTETSQVVTEDAAQYPSAVMEPMQVGSELEPVPALAQEPSGNSIAKVSTGTTGEVTFPETAGHLYPKEYLEGVNRNSIQPSEIRLSPSPLTEMSSSSSHEAVKAVVEDAGAQEFEHQSPQQRDDLEVQDRDKVEDATATPMLPLEDGIVQLLTAQPDDTCTTEPCTQLCNVQAEQQMAPALQQGEADGDGTTDLSDAAPTHEDTSPTMNTDQIEVDSTRENAAAILLTMRTKEQSLEYAPLDSTTSDALNHESQNCHDQDNASNSSKSNPPGGLVEVTWNNFGVDRNELETSKMISNIANQRIFQEQNPTQDQALLLQEKNDELEYLDTIAAPVSSADNAEMQIPAPRNLSEPEYLETLNASDDEN